MQNEPWTMERLRKMTRQEFRECEKRGDLPPAELAVELVAERLGMRVERGKRL
jgi:hypothetical protein